jgi:hypothetical protein
LKEKAGYWLLSSKRKSTICNRSLLWVNSIRRPCLWQYSNW